MNGEIAQRERPYTEGRVVNQTKVVHPFPTSELNMDKQNKYTIVKGDKLPKGDTESAGLCVVVTEAMGDMQVGRAFVEAVKAIEVFYESEDEKKRR